MQRVILLLLVLVGLSCSRPAKESINMSGAYRMLSQKIKDADTDSLITGAHQLKIYTPEFMMYVNFNERDSLAAFGIGTYMLNSRGLTENVIYSASDSVIQTDPASYNLGIEVTPTGYKQIIGEIMMGGNPYELTEEYENVSMEKTSPLDGAWKLVRIFDVIDGDTSVYEMTQYKTYHTGHFMYGFTFLDSTGKPHTGMGYGNFEMLGDNKVREVVTVSTYNIVGRTFDIDLIFDGPDNYTQIITDSTGVKNVEVYERMKAMGQASAKR